MKVRCPACGKFSEYDDNPYRPFCCRVCKGHDVINWAEGTYRIAGREVAEDGEYDGQLPDNC